MIHKFYRKSQGAILLGVCNGIADSYSIDPRLMRILVVSAAFFTFFLPFVILGYLLLGFFLPIHPKPRNSFQPFRRSIRDKLLGGVCSGIANYFHLQVVLVRVFFCIFAFFAHLLPAIFIYLIFCFFTPLSSLEDEDEIEIYEA